MTTSVAFCCLAATLTAAPAPVLTLNGQPLAQAVEVDVLRPATTLVVEPTQAEGQEESEESGGLPPVAIGALAGAAFGCAVGAGISIADSGAIDAAPLCLIGGVMWAGVGAGAVALVRWIQRR